AVDRIAACYPGHQCRIEVTQVSTPVRILAKLLRPMVPLLKETALRDSVSRFRDFDALVVPELGSLRLKRRLPNLPIILTQHGAGDGAAGFDSRIAQADFILVPGRKLERRYRGDQLIRNGNYAVVGYPKFDAIDKVVPDARPVFDDERTVVLYNPHFDSRRSSWHKWGTKVLDFFADHTDRYDLIFAPHVKLFEQWLRRGAYLPPRFLRCPNIHIDLGGPASADMTYTRTADIYLGDVSSQIYEYLRNPRPCVFLNSHGVDWEKDPNYAHWHFGPVVNDISELGMMLDRAMAEHTKFRPVQEHAFADTFVFTEPSAVVNAARAILKFITRRELSRNSS
ncbi:MAG: hypothetical protein WD750_12895, partial [Gammaproteobacteria bacterium]